MKCLARSHKPWSGLPFPSPVRESKVAQSCPTLSDPMDCSLPDSSVHGIFQARVLKWDAIAFSTLYFTTVQKGIWKFIRKVITWDKRPGLNRCQFHQLKMEKIICTLLWKDHVSSFVGHF